MQIDANADNLMTAGLVGMVVVVALGLWLCRHLNHDAHRYAVGARKAMRRLSKKLNRANRLPNTKTNLAVVEGELSNALMNLEDVTGKINDNAIRLKLEQDFMVVRGDLPDLPVRVCVGDLIFSFNEGHYNQDAVLKSLNDFNRSLTKLTKI